jgi:hypothetical protein
MILHVNPIYLKFLYVFIIYTTPQYHISFSRGFARRFANIQSPSPVRPCRGVADTELPPGARHRASGGCGLGLVDWNGTIGIVYFHWCIWKLLWFLWNILWNIWCIWLYMIVHVWNSTTGRIYSCLQSQLWCASLKRPQRLPPCNTPVIMAMLVVFGQSFWSGLKTGYQTQKLATIWINGCMGVEWVESDINNHKLWVEWVQSLLHLRLRFITDEIPTAETNIWRLGRAWIIQLGHVMACHGMSPFKSFHLASFPMFFNFQHMRISFFVPWGNVQV